MSPQDPNSKTQASSPDNRGDEVHGDKVAGDKVAGNKVEIGSIVNTGSGQVNVAGGDINIFQRIVNFFQGDTEAQRAFRNRQNMLQLVWNTWIEGVLKKSLHNEVLIELGMETRPDAVEHPWDMVVQMPDREPEIVKPGMTMLELFDQSNGSLLILGEPGSGKTTMLLELARLAILRAQEDPLQPIPVVFNLSSWKPDAKKKPAQVFADWLVDELRNKYYVSSKIGKLWIDKGELLLLLDGLDEVGAENRETCVQAINAFRSEHSMSVVVSSRRQEYEELAAQIKLHGAILLQALSEEQVEAYLQKAGNGLTAVRQALMRDAELREFARTPLILSILILAYRDATEEDLRTLEVEGDCRQQLFDAYIAQMFKRRSAAHPYPEQKTRCCLAWLTRGMLAHNQSLFYIEDIQSSWLPFSKWKRRLIFGLVGGMIAWLFSGLIFGLSFGLSFGLIEGKIEELIAGLIVGLYVGLLDGPFGRSFSGLFFGLSAGLFGWLSGDTRPTEKLSWSWEKTRNGLISGLFGCLIVGLISGLFGYLIVGLSAGLGGALLSGLFFGLSGSAIENRNLPGDGVKTSLKNFLLVGLFVGLFLGLTGGPSVWLSGGSSGGLSGGLIVGSLAGLRYGGIFLFTHLLSRLALFCSGRLPWNIIPFLDYCTERIFLRKVGGGYIFIHRMLMEHFAEMDEERIKALTQAL